MSTQTERQSSISERVRIGAHKSRVTVRPLRIRKTTEIQGVALKRTTNRLTQQNGPSPYNGNLHRRGARTFHAERLVPSEEFTAPQMKKIFHTAYRITRNREDAEDAIQDACLQAVAHFQDFDGRSKFSTWLTRIAINSPLMVIRKRRNARTVPLDNAADSEESTKFQEVSDTAPDAEKRYLQEERDTALRCEVDALRPALKGVVELARLGECSLRETAETLGLSVSAVKARLFHARRTLQKSKRLCPFRSDQPTNRQDARKRSL